MSVRMAIRFDGASTEAVRELSVALNKVLGDNRLTLGVEGPDAWHGETPKLTANQFADVVGLLVKYRGEPIGEVAKRIGDG